MNDTKHQDKLVPALERPLRLRVWELLCLLTGCVIFGMAISDYQTGHLHRQVQPLPDAIAAFIFILAPAIGRMAEKRRLARAKLTQATLDGTGSIANPISLKDDGHAVSPVIGVILMVAITVILAAVVTVLVMHLVSHAATSSPIIALATSDNGATYYVQSSSTPLNYIDLTITGCTGIPTGIVKAGDNWTSCTGILTVSYKPTNTILYRSA